MSDTITLQQAKAYGLVPEEGMIFLGYRGSIAHGMHVPSSNPESIDDVDLIGAYIAPITHYLGLSQSKGKQTMERSAGQYDSVSYEIRHLFRLLLKSNPNVLSILWLEDEFILETSDLYELIRENRECFIGKRAAFESFTGYARGQLHRMTNFDGPAREKMRALEAEMIQRGIPLNAVPERYRAPEHMKTLPNNGPRFSTIKTFDLVTAYAEMRNRYTSGYMGEKRRQLVEKFGYDTKNAAHLIRLLRMAVHYLRSGEGELIVNRPDASELLEIKTGGWKLEHVKQHAEWLFIEAEKAYTESTLPEFPDTDRAERLLMHILCDYHHLQG